MLDSCVGPFYVRRCCASQRSMEAQALILDFEALSTRVPVQGCLICMASSVDPEAVHRLRKLLQDKLGDRAQRYSDDNLQQLIGRGYDDEQSLQVASREGLLAARLNDGQADELRAVFQGALCSPHKVPWPCAPGLLLS